MSAPFELERLRAEFDASLAQVRDAAALAELRNAWVAKKGGRVTAALAALRDVPAAERPAVGEAVNALKRHVESALAARADALRAADVACRLEAEAVDPTLPGLPPDVGGLHPIRIIQDRIEEIFTDLGYAVAHGPDVEDDFHNFEALNVPPDHPARDAQDTFFLRDGSLLRTHTSPVQVRAMRSQPPPVRIICPGKVYRRDQDASHSPMFHQFEGLVVDEGITFADLKGTIALFFLRLLGPSMSVRLRPSYFPFTEPSAEVDISCVLCGGRGCGPCKGSGFLEVMGAGMVHPAVFEAVGYDPERVTGFAFGGGIDRMAMLAFGLPSLGPLFENDIRLLRQFR